MSENFSEHLIKYVLKIILKQIEQHKKSVKCFNVQMQIYGRVDELYEITVFAQPFRVGNLEIYGVDDKSDKNAVWFLADYVTTLFYDEDVSWYDENSVVKAFLKNRMIKIKRL